MVTMIRRYRPCHRSHPAPVPRSCRAVPVGIVGIRCRCARSAYLVVSAFLVLVACDDVTAPETQTPEEEPFQLELLSEPTTGRNLHGVWTDGSAAVAVGDRVILRSTDGGASWTKAESNATQWLTGVGGHGSTAMAVGMSGITFRTTDGGATWTSLPSPVGHWLREVRGHGDELWMVGEEGILVHSTDGGGSWSDEGIGAGLGIHSLSVPEPGKLVAVGRGGLVLRGSR